MKQPAERGDRFGVRRLVAAFQSADKSAHSIRLSSAPRTQVNVNDLIQGGAPKRRLPLAIIFHASGVRNTRSPSRQVGTLPAHSCFAPSPNPLPEGEEKPVSIRISSPDGSLTYGIDQTHLI
jgi:hypothetical protein